MLKKLLIGIGITLAAFGILAGIKTLQIKAMIAAGEQMAMPPETVSTATVESARWNAYIEAVASVRAVRGVVVSAEVPGTVREIAFESGTDAAEGDLLVRLDTVAEEADLAAAQADAALAAADLDRAEDLSKRRVISVSDYDTAIAKHKQALARVVAAEAAIAKKTIRAPFAGRLGIREVDPGQYIQSGHRIVSLQASNEVHVDFALPQQRLADLAPGLEVAVTTDTYPDTMFTGKLAAVDSAVDEVTRTIAARALLPNPDGRLVPGMFVRARVILPQSRDVLLIPSTAVLFASSGDSVFVVENGTDPKSGKPVKTARQSLVKLGENRGDFVEILDGLKPGDTVAGSGVFKLRTGTTLEINNAIAPKAQLEPEPDDA